MEKKILTDNHIIEYFKKKKNEKALVKYSNFNFLIYLAKVVDIPTSENIAKQIVEESVDEETLNSIVESILPYC